jgi:predicted esterase
MIHVKCHKKYILVGIIIVFLSSLILNSLKINNNRNFIRINKEIITELKSGQEGTIKSGELVLGTTDGYNWWSYVPESLQRNDNAYILLEMSHGQLEDYNTLTNDAKQNVMNWISIAEEKKYILVTTVVPRNFSQGYYPQGINMYSLDPLTPEFYYRPDLKVNNIIDELIGNLTDAGYSPCNKILVAGFSAGGMWANRYTLLHPERVLAAAIGQAGGWLAMPLIEYNNTKLNWPMGINNLYNLTGIEYNKQNLLKEVPQFIFIGDQDTYSTYCENYPSCNDIKIWGETDPERLDTQCNYLINHNFLVEFKQYAGVGHSYTQSMKDDVFDFFGTVIKNYESGNDGPIIPNYSFFVLFPISLISILGLIFYSRKRLKLN